MKFPELLDFIVQTEKYIFAPIRFIEYLCFLLNPEDMTISLSDKKKEEKIKLVCSQILKHESPIIRTVAKFLGKFSSSFLAAHCGKVH